MKDIPTKINGDFFEADECNSIASEEENLVTTAGQTLSASDNFQLSKAASIYAAAGDFYEDAGSANVYVLSPVSPRYAPPSYVDGMKARFKPGVTNTGASTVNVDAIGIKDIKNRDGSAVSSGEIGAGDYVDVVFELSNNYFVITNRSDVSNNIPYGTAVESSANVYTLDLGGVYSAYDNRMYFRCQFPTTNTGAVTLNIDGIGAKTLNDNARGEPFIGGEIESPIEYLIAYDVGSAKLRVINRFSATDAMMNAGVIKTVNTTPYDVARAIQENRYLNISAGGVADTYTASTTPSFSTLVDGSIFNIFISGGITNTGASTLNINSIGAKALKAAGDITAPANYFKGNNTYAVRYHGPAEDYFVVEGVGQATSGEVEAATNDAQYITALKMKYHQGVAKAWVNFNGTGTIAIRDSYNVSSLTDIGTGDYDINFTNAMANANYATAGLATSKRFCAYGNNTTGYFNIEVIDTADSHQDEPNVTCIVFGDI